VRKPRRQPVCFADSILHRLNAYSLAAGAAAAGTFAASPAQAEVVYTPVQVTVSLAGPTYYYVNPAGTTNAPFLFAAGFTSPNAYWDTIPFDPYSDGARVAQKAGGARWSIASLKAGMVIGPGRHFDSRYSEGLVATYGPYGGGTYYRHAGFKFGHPIYIGFRFFINGETHYGWARVTVRFNPSTPKRRLYGQLTGYAYESVANQSIRAGQTSGTFSSKDSTESEPESKLDGPPATPEPAAPDQFLGLLALGASGVPA
jgi:hypothetical protein